MSPLERKLLRDLWRIKGQAAAIGAVIAVGVMMLVMMTGLVNSLDETRRAYYERYRLADVFAPVTRAPDRLLDRLAAIDGVAAVQGRVTGSALIDLPGLDLPLQAKTVSLPDFGEPRVNDVLISAGRALDGGHADEVLLLESFANARALRPGDSLQLTMNGARRSFRIVGLAQAPEFLFTTAPGELAPDPGRFGVVWISQSALAAAFDMKGAFNEALIALGRGGDAQAVIAAIDRVLDPNGGLGAYGREDLASNRYISEEINGLRSSSRGVPPIFLAVAAFLLYLVVSRMVQAERGQIGLMKAFGYTDVEVGYHYLKLVLAIAVAGAAAGCLFGIAAGRGLAELYLEYYRFPFLVFRLEPTSFVLGFLVSILSASAGGLLVLRGVFGLAPATAMRAPVPPDFSRSGRIAHRLSTVLDQPARMVLRRVTRQPGRMAGAALGIAAGMALSVGMVSILAGFERTMSLNFDVIDRSDVSVTFIDAVSQKTILELARLPGVLEVEPVRDVAATLRNGRHTYRGAVNGLTDTARLYRAVDDELQTIELPLEGIVLATSLAEELDISPGQTLTVEVRQGRRPVLEVPVTGVADTLLGSPAYMRLDALNRALHEPRRVSGAYLRIDAAQSSRLYRTLERMPTVAGVSLKRDARDAFGALMDSGAGAIRYVMVLMAAIITFGIVYNAARIAFAERARDLASLRVIGFTKNEVAFVLLGELAVIVLIALPAGSLLGYFLTFGIAAGFSTDLYRIPAVITPASHGLAALAVLGAAIASGWLVKRDADRADPVSALKSHE